MKNIPLLTFPVGITSEEEEAPRPPPISRLIVPNKSVPTEDEHVRGVSKRLTAGYAETIGLRKSMEDRMTIFGSFRAKEDEDYFAVFDGHNGDASAKYCAGRMHVRLRDVLEKQDGNWDPVVCFKEAFQTTNQGLEKARAGGGTTAVVALFKGDDLYIANVGDSRAVLSSNNCASRVTTDHKPDLPLEKERILKNGGWVAKGGITGTLTVSRSLGDFSYQPFITCEPDVFGPYLLRDSSHQLLILACDGLWDVVTDDEAVAIALSAYDPEDAAVKLRDTAFKNNSKDNISVLVIFFPLYVPPEKPAEPEPEPEPVVNSVAEKNSQNKEEKIPRKSSVDRKTRRTKSSGLSVSRDAISTPAKQQKLHSPTISQKDRRKGSLAESPKSSGSAAGSRSRNREKTNSSNAENAEQENSEHNSETTSKVNNKTSKEGKKGRTSTASGKSADKSSGKSSSGLTGSGGAVLETTKMEKSENQEKKLDSEISTIPEPGKPDNPEKTGNSTITTNKSTKSTQQRKTGNTNKAAKTDNEIVTRKKKPGDAVLASKKRKHKTDKPPEKTEDKE